MVSTCTHVKIISNTLYNVEEDVTLQKETQQPPKGKRKATKKAKEEHQPPAVEGTNLQNYQV